MKTSIVKVHVFFMLKKFSSDHLHKIERGVKKCEIQDIVTYLGHGASSSLGISK